MSNIKDEDEGMKAYDIELINKKRIVFIVDEAHRSTFGDMLITIKSTFTSAIFFGFTGTPIQDENQKKLNTTSTVFGDELHRYSIADGIRDKNVLGFDPYKILTYKDRDLRRAVALEKAKAIDEAEALADPNKREIFNKFMSEVRMAGHINNSGLYVKGIEDYIPKSQYDRDEHFEMVVNDILQSWLMLSQNSKFHAIFATSSIADAIDYYRLIKATKPDLKITALFDPNIDNNGNTEYKEDGLVEIMTDYNERYNQDFNLAKHSRFKKDIASRLAHKEPYIRIENKPEEQIDILIVVDQMLTGFDSKWINTLYMDKVLKYENIIQAFSRTNRLFGPDKPFGTIRYYRFPHSMERNINDAIKLYSGDKPISLFVERLDANLNAMNYVFSQIRQLFETAKVGNFEHLPDDVSERGRFANLFKELNIHLEAAKIQGFTWKKLKYQFGKGSGKIEVNLSFDESIYLVLALRYKELFNSTGGGDALSDIPFEIEGYLTEIDTQKIDADYMNSRFEKYLKNLKKENIDAAELQNTLDELHKSFAFLSQEEQKYANIFIHDVQGGLIDLESGKTFRDYVTEYLYNAKNDQVKKISEIFGLNEVKLRNLMDSGLTQININEYGRFDELKDTVDKNKAKIYFEKLVNTSVPAFKVNIKVHNLLQKFVIEGGFDI
jgi:type I restriction enzyme R subunit